VKDQWHVSECDIGWIGLRRGETGLTRVALPAYTRAAAIGSVCRDAQHAPDDPLLQEAAHRLKRYFAGDRIELDLPIELRGVSDFARRVLEACATIPRGQTCTYGELARLAGSPGAARAVGQVMASNPLPLVVPCHRVVGADGRLVGFGSGLDMKRTLLALEGIDCQS